MAGMPTLAKANSLHLCLLGTFRIERDAHPIALPTRKVESLLAYLALFPEPHPREKLAALLWGDSTDEQARHSLRSALTTLRAKLGDDLLLADRETVQVNPDCPLWVDAREFQQSAISNTQSTIELYPGDLLADFYDDWIEPERERLRALYLDALLKLAQAARSHSQYTHAIELAHKVLASDPANEKAYQHIIFCLAATGDRIGALKQYDECRKKLHDELSVEPSSETVALRDHIEQELTGAPSREALLTNVPTPLTSFVGRQREVEEIKRLLDPSGLGDPKGLSTRLLTLTGAGGCGKTRLAIQVATDLAHANLYKHGVWWVELAALSNPALVPKQVAQVFGLPESPDVPITTVLTNYLHSKELLLVLDNCEHLIEACAQLAETLLSACPNLRILTTSREALGLTGEVAWYVPSLESPDPQNMPPPANLPQYDAIRLLTERAQAVAPHWQLADHAEAAARICCRLDGIPLAIELAAVRLKVLSAEQVAEWLDDRFQLLTGGSRTALPRQRTLRAAIDWSYNLLSGVESALLRRLAVFAGGWTLASAEAVAGADPISAGAVLDLLTALVDKSLVVVEPEGRETRYKFLETVRQYAHEKLQEAHEAEACSRRHWNWFFQLAQEAEPKLRSGEQLEWGERLERDMENLRAALRWSLAQTDLEGPELAQRLAGKLARFWYVHGYWDEGMTWTEQSLENRAITPARAGALMGLARLKSVATQDNCRALWEESLALYRQQGDKWGIAFTAGFCGARSDPQRASALFAEAHSIARELNDEWLAAATHNMHGLYARQQGDLALAGSLFQAVIDHARRSGDVTVLGNGLCNLGEVTCEQGDYDRAIALHEQAVSIARNADKTWLAERLNGLGRLARRQCDYVRAIAAYTEALQLSREIKDVRGQAIFLSGLGDVALHEHDYARARALLAECLPLQRQFKRTYGILYSIAGLAMITGVNGKPRQAVQLLGAVQAAVQTLDLVRHPADRMEYDRILAAVRAQLDEATFNAAWEEGGKMTLEQAIEYALET